MSKRRLAGSVWAAGVLSLALVAAGCGGGADDDPGSGASADAGSPTSATASTAPSTAPSTARPTPSVSSPTPSPEAPTSSAGPAYSTWKLGVHVLPVTDTGFGEIRPTPAGLRERRYPTDDVLPPPADGRFHSSVGAITESVRTAMGNSWEPGCPVALADLRYLRVSFWGFDDRAHTGELVGAASVADDVVSVFAELFRARFPIEQLTLPSDIDPSPRPTGDGNGSAGFACRASRSGAELSAHAYGLAIDIDPFQNPYDRGDGLVLPERASSYLDRDWRRPGMIEPDGVVVRAFTRIGWTWGGTFSSVKDYMHFSQTGR